MTEARSLHGGGAHSRGWRAGGSRLLLALAISGSVLTAGGATEPAPRWVTVWAVAPAALRGDAVPTISSVSDQTIRQRMRLSLGATRLRVRISNEYGDTPLTLDAASVALCDDVATATAASPLRLIFGGRWSVTVPPGAPVYSDAVELSAPAFAHVCVSLHLPRATLLSSVHFDGHDTAVVSSPGDFALSASVPVAQTSLNHYFVTAIEAQSSAPVRTVVTFGDSITDGAGSTADRDRRWPDVFAELAARYGPEPLAVANAGISGNRLLRDGPYAGVSALTRFDRDVLAVAGVTDVVVLEGINDLGWVGAVDGSTLPSADDLIRAHQQLIARAHGHGLRIYGGTLTPFEGTVHPGYFTPQKDAIREALNDWIRHSGAYDAVIDFDAVVRDPGNPHRMQAEYDSGDHLHPGEAGLQAMAWEAARVLGVKLPAHAPAR